MTTRRASFNVIPGHNANSRINVAYVRYDPHTTAGWLLIILPLWHASLRHPAGNTSLPEGEPCIAMYNMNVFGTSAFIYPPPAGLFSCSRLRGGQGTRLKSGCKFRSRSGSMSRALGVQSREIWQISTGRHSERLEPSRHM